MLLPPSATAFAQSGAKQDSDNRPVNPQTQEGSGQANMQPALEGYCPVCIIEMKEWVKGNPQISAVFDGHLYLFPSEEQKKMFEANPTKYVPVLGGDCVVAYQKMDKRVAGNIRQAAMHEDRLFLFSNDMAKQEFLKNPEAYAKADVALDGKCTVCRVEMNKEVAGNPEIGVLYQGLRYYFPEDKQREMFIANPQKYAVKAASGEGEEGSGSGNSNQGNPNQGSSGG